MLQPYASARGRICRNIVTKWLKFFKSKSIMSTIYELVASILGSIYVSLRTKSHTPDLNYETFWEYDYLYAFPFHLLDRESISRLQHMQLRFVSLNPLSQFKGFPNLRKLYLKTLHINWNHLENMLFHCCTLEWLCIDRCRLNNELIVDSPLSRLLFFRVEFCSTKIKFNAVNLATFKYDGSFIPIDLAQFSRCKVRKLSSVVQFFQHAFISLLNGLPTLQNVTLEFRFQNLDKQWLWDNPLKFTNLKHLWLSMYIIPKDVDKILYSLAFLRATPFIEKLEVHFAGCALWLARTGPCRKGLGQCKYVHLKHIRVTGFRAARGQLEFLLHVIENAPALEVVSVEIGQYTAFEYCSDGAINKSKEIARACMRPILPYNVTFEIIE